MTDREFWNNKRIVEERKRQNQERYVEASKERLKELILKRQRTTMIGALASFEEHFGHLWGHGKENPTENQRAFARIWEETRREILDKGNENIRTMIDDLDQFDCKWNKYQTNFNIKG